MDNLSRVATLASNRNSNPDARWQAFKRLCELSSDEMLGDLAMLYHSFSPRPKRTRFTSRFDWLGLAVAGKDDVRHYLRYIQVSDSGAAVATDGHRLHVTTIDDRDPGYYRPDGTTTDDDFKYPDVARVLKGAITSDTRPLEAAIEGVEPINKKKPAKKGGEAYRINTGGESPLHLNKRYVDDAILGADMANVGIGHNGDHRTAAFLQVDNARFAIVMPLKMGR